MKIYDDVEELMKSIKDTSRDYVGTNGCLYQDIAREELDLIVNEIERLNNRIDKAIEYIKSFDYYIPEDDKPKLLDILKGSDKE